MASNSKNEICAYGQKNFEVHLFTPSVSYLAPIRIFLPLFIERFTSKSALTWWYWSALYSLISSATTPLVVHYMPQMVLGGYEMVFIGITGVVDSIFGTINFVSTMSFHAQISDPLLGGVYMTLLNSAANFGGGWPETFGKLSFYETIS